MPDAIIAAIIACFISFFASALVFAGGLRHHSYRREVAMHQKYLSWLRGLIPESEFLISCVDELHPAFQQMLAGGPPIVPTKQLNSDFLAAARIGIMEHPRSVILFPRLTSTYRDVVHTNDMMSRFERLCHELINLPMAGLQFQPLLQSTAACFPSVR